jgi:membrane protease YdiL (CAAX protease family)
MSSVLYRLPIVAVAASLLAGYLVVGLPIVGLWQQRELRRRLTQDPGLRLVLYRQAISRHWLVGGAALGIVGMAGFPASSAGVRLRLGPISAATIALALVLLVGAVVTRSRTALLPVTPAEKRLFAVVAVTAGVAEELLFRGFLMLFLTDVAGWSWQSAAAGSAIAFGLNHLYQGVRPALASAAAGYLLAEIYLQTGSLVLPALIHAAVDLVALRAPRRGRAGYMCSASRDPSSRSPSWKTRGGAVSTPSAATSSSVGAVGEALKVRASTPS